MPTHILGVSAFYHDSAACLIRDGEIVAAAQEERFTRKKFDARFPSNAIRYCLKEAGISWPISSTFVFYDKPLIKFERLLETYVAFSPKGIQSFLAAMPVWMKEKLLLKNEIQNQLVSLDGVKQVRPAADSFRRAPRIPRRLGFLSFPVQVRRRAVHGRGG